MGVRQTVLWVGTSPSQVLVESFQSRDLALRQLSMQECAKVWNSARAAVFWMPTNATLESLYSNGIQSALAHGIRVRIVLSLGNIEIWSAKLRKLPYYDPSWLLVDTAQTGLAESFARHEPGPAHDSRVNLHSNIALSTEESILLQRAFNDCTEVHLQQMPDGTAKVFIAYAKLTDSRVGAYPLPLFVKIDERTRAEKERKNYGEYTTTFIPFYARPNLHLSRCLMGAHLGIIVGDFVERSESMLDLVKRGVAQSAIDSLFQDSLRSWRAQPYWGNQPVAEEKLYSKCIPDSVLGRKADLLANYSKMAASLGSTLDVNEIVRRLDNLPAIRHRRGWTHGDLHCGNVRARAGEAILIDFLSVGPGALSTDPATLEVSLALEFDCDEVQWQKAMSELYSVDNLRTVPRPREPMAPLHGLWEAVRQIRRFGLAEQVDENEYCRAVAIQLVRKAAHKRNPGEGVNRRPYFIKLSADLVIRLQDQVNAANPKSLTVANRKQQ